MGRETGAAATVTAVLVVGRTETVQCQGLLHAERVGVYSFQPLQSALPRRSAKCATHVAVHDAGRVIICFKHRLSPSPLPALALAPGVPLGVVLPSRPTHETVH